MLEVEGVDRKLFAERGDLLGLSALGQDDAELLVGEGPLGFIGWLDAQDMAEEDIRAFVQQGNGGTEEGLEEPERRA